MTLEDKEIAVDEKILQTSSASPWPSTHKRVGLRENSFDYRLFISVRVNLVLLLLPLLYEFVYCAPVSRATPTWQEQRRRRRHHRRRRRRCRVF